MTKLLKASPFPLLFLLLFSACSTNNHQDEEIFQYKDSYVGDNNAVINITSQLSTADDVTGFEIKSKEEPFGLIIHYDWQETNPAIKKSVINDASYLFTLIQNVDWITFQSDSFKYEITRENIEDWYGRELSDITNEEDLRELIQEHIENDEKVKQLYAE